MEADVRVARRFGASPERVFAAWLDARSAGGWLFATASRPVDEVAIDPRVGGEFRFVERRRGTIAVRVGRYLEIVPPRRLVFTLACEPCTDEVSRVAIDIVPCAEGCELVLGHSDVPPAERERTEGRWTGILYGLAETLDAPVETRAFETKERS